MQKDKSKLHNIANDQPLISEYIQNKIIFQK